MLIHEAAVFTGLTKKAIRYYAEQGLLPTAAVPPPHADTPSYHRYSPDELKRLILIRKLRGLGLTLADIKLLLQPPAGEITGLLSACLKRMDQELALRTETRDKLAGLLEAIPPSPSLEALEEALDKQPSETLQTGQVFNRICELFPGPFGRILAHHYLPFLEEAALANNQQAWDELIQALDELPTAVLPEDISRLYLQLSEQALTEMIDQFRLHVTQLLQADDEALEAIAQQTRQLLQLQQKNSPSPLQELMPSIRKMKENLAAIKFYDVVPELIRRYSPSYDEYCRRLERLQSLVPVRYGSSDYVLEDINGNPEA